MKQKAFIRYTKSGKIVPGSLIVTGSGGYPKDGTFKEVTPNLCCSGVELRQDISGLTFPFAFGIYIQYGCMAPSSDYVQVYVPVKPATIQELVIALNARVPMLGQWTLRGDILALDVTTEMIKATCPPEYGAMLFILDDND